MTFTSQKEAKKFLAERIIAEAEREHLTLSDDDKRLLYFSEAEPETVQGISDDRLLAEDEEYEAKIVALLRSAYERDKAALEGPLYKEATAKLREGDHYLSVMADEAFSKAPQVGSFPVVRTSVLFIGLGVGVALVLLMALYIGLTNR